MLKTSENVKKSADEREELAFDMRAVLMHGDLTEVHDCCGDKHTRDAFAGRVLPYCPYCGSRVVSGDAN